MRIIHLNESHRKAWDEFVLTTPESGFMQSWAWSGFKELEKQNVRRIGVFDQEKLLAGAMVYYVPSSFGSSPLELPHGPVLPWKQRSLAAECMELIRSELGRIAREVKAPMIRIEPMIVGDLPGYLGALVRAPLDLIPTDTLVAAVFKNDQAILDSMSSKGRYNIRLALKKGVEVFSSGNEGDVDEFYALFELTCNRHHFQGESRGFFKNMMRHLGPSGMAKLYFSRYKGMILSSAIMITFGEKATYLYGGQSSFLPSVMANYALHWSMMTDAREMGCRAYDFYGIAPDNDPFHPYARFSQFKSRFGGTRVTTAGAHDIYLYEQLAELWVKNMRGMPELSKAPVC